MKRIQDLTKAEFFQLKQAHKRVVKSNKSMLSLLSGKVDVDKIIATYQESNEAAFNFFVLLDQFGVAQVKRGKEILSLKSSEFSIRAEPRKRKKNKETQ